MFKFSLKKYDFYEICSATTREFLRPPYGIFSTSLNQMPFLELQKKFRKIVHTQWNFAHPALTIQTYA